MFKNNHTADSTWTKSAVTDKFAHLILTIFCLKKENQQKVGEIRDLIACRAVSACVCTPESQTEGWMYDVHCKVVTITSERNSRESGEHILGVKTAYSAEQ